MTGVFESLTLGHADYIISSSDIYITWTTVQAPEFCQALTWLYSHDGAKMFPSGSFLNRGRVKPLLSEGQTTYVRDFKGGH